MDPSNSKLPPKKRAYLKPEVRSAQAFEASLACLKIPGTPMCALNVSRSKS